MHRRTIALVTLLAAGGVAAVADGSRTDNATGAADRSGTDNGAGAVDRTGADARASRSACC